VPGLLHHKVNPGIDPNEFLLLASIVGFCSPLSKSSWSAISDIADGFRNINSATNSGLASTGSSFQDLLAAASEHCLRLTNTLIFNTFKKKNNKTHQY
jgi:hypothetical protein